MRTSKHGEGAVQRVTLVIGGSSGIGLAVAVRLRERNECVVVAARSDAALRAAERLAEGAEEDVVDVRSGSDVESLVRRTITRYGRLDAVVLTSAVMAYGEVERVPPDVFDAVVETAVRGTANVARTVVPVFRAQGHGTLVIINSLLGSVTVPGMGAYATAKWGQRALVRTLQQELRDERELHVCMVSPGSIDTPIYRQSANYVGRRMRPPMPVRSAEHAAAVVVAVLDRPRNHVSIPVGALNPIIIIGFRLFPFVYDRLARVMLRLLSTTRDRVAATTGNVLAPHPEGEGLHGL